MLDTGIAWQDLPPEFGFGSGSPAGGRLEERHRCLHRLRPGTLRSAAIIDSSRAIVDPDLNDLRTDAERLKLGAATWLDGSG